MSRCISREGEYSDHELATSGPTAERFVCRRCHGLAEDELLAALDMADATIARVRDEANHFRAKAARAQDPEEVLSAYMFCAARVDAALDSTDGTGPLADGPSAQAFRAFGDAARGTDGGNHE